MNTSEVETVISALNATGDCLVLRRLNLEHDTRISRTVSELSQVALCIDTETTGLNYAGDKVIELGIVAFEFNPSSGEIYAITERYSGFEDPGMPIPEVIREITGITNEMVCGQTFNDKLVNALAEKAHLVIAHNAAFDRKFVEARFPIFAKLPWACTFSQIDWKAERISSRSLEYLLFKTGRLIINAHRALDDAEGVLGLLLEQLPVSGAPVFKTLLQKANDSTSRICAVAAPFDKKDLLKRRGYRWNDGTQGGSKTWWRDVSYEAEREELDYLARDIYPQGNTGLVEISRFDGYSRFSLRACV